MAIAVNRKKRSQARDLEEEQQEDIGTARAIGIVEIRQTGRFDCNNTTSTSTTTTSSSSRRRTTLNSLNSVLGEELQRRMFMKTASEKLKKDMANALPLSKQDLSIFLISQIYKHIQSAYALGYDCRGYCENTLNSMNSLMQRLDSLCDPSDNGGTLSLTAPDASFIDIGSGFGKVVFHARLSHLQLKECVGIEVDEARHKLACDALSIFSSYISNCFSNEQSDHGIRFFHADAREQQQLNFTHVFMFDYVFPEDVYDKLLPVLERSPFRVLVSWRRLVFLQKHGLHNIRLLNTFPLSTTGKQRLMCYIYCKTIATDTGQ